MKKVTIKWYTRNETTISKICCRFNIDYHPTINGMNEAEIADEDLELFKETAKRGHFAICKQ